MFGFKGNVLQIGHFLQLEPFKVFIFWKWINYLNSQINKLLIVRATMEIKDAAVASWIKHIGMLLIKA